MSTGIVSSDIPPDGLHFVARLIGKDRRQKYGYTPFVITGSRQLWYKATNGYWYFMRKATEADIFESTKCFKTMDEMNAFYDELKIAG